MTQLQPTTDNTPAPNHTPAIPELEQIKKTLSTLAALVREQNERLTALEQAAADNPALTPKQAALQRYQLSSKDNRTINARPVAIALAAHLMHFKSVPTTTVFQSGLLPQGKAYALRLWAPQHLQDYCAINDQTAVLEQGMTLEQMQEGLPPAVAKALAEYATQPPAPPADNTAARHNQP